MEHDQSYKLLFSHARMVEDLVCGFIHAPWVQQVDFATLERVNASFVSDDLREREDDVIWRVRWGQERWLYLYIMLEFQSTVDWFMAVRLLVYIGLLYQTLIRSGEVKSGDKLPPVLPLVLYNGKQRWKAPVELSALMEARPPGLKAYHPRLRYVLLDEQRYTDVELTPLRNLAAALFRLEKSRQPRDLAAVLEALRAWLAQPEDDALRRAFVVWLKRVLLPGRLPGVDVPDVHTLEEMQTMLAEQVVEWTRQWKDEGIKEGRAEGRAEGHAVLLRLARKRFAETTVQAFATAIKRIEDPEHLATLAEAIVECATDEEFLARLQA